MMLVRAALRARRAPIIWAFHDVSDEEWFTRCIEDIISAREVLPLAEMARRPPRPDTCTITFDDGLRSILSVAAPVLSQYQLPYTVFVCTDVLAGGSVPWFLRVAHLTEELGLREVRSFWRLSEQPLRTKEELIIALKQLRFDLILEGVEALERRFSISPPKASELFLSSDDVITLSKAGVVFGSHTHRHPILSLLSVEEQSVEVEQSRGLITSLTGRPPIEFAYPNGSSLDFDRRTIGILRSLGFQLAVTTTQRHLTETADRFALPRIGISDGSSSLRRALAAVFPEVSLSHMRERRIRGRIAGFASKFD
jgi:peptidoglycan/xylan/chitin deacetylase (PgdA/CDA1 family)